MSAETIAGHYCGQTQPHAAHTWETPPVYGSTQLISRYQCGGYSAPPEVPMTLCGHGSAICAPCDFIPWSWKPGAS